MKNWVKIFIGIAVLLALAVAGAYSYFNFKKSSFNTDTVFLKVVLLNNSSSTSNVEIRNTLNSPMDFVLDVRDEETKDLISLEESSFSLGGGQSRKVAVELKSAGKNPGVYLGNIEILSGKERQKIPAIIEIQSSDVDFGSSINLFPQGGDILPGQKMNFEINLFDLGGVGRQKIRLDYALRDFNGKTILSSSEDVVVDSKLKFVKSIDMPSNAEYGAYAFTASVNYNGSVGTSSLFFRVADESRGISFENGIIWILVIFLLVFIVFVVIFIRSLFSRDQMLVGMRRDYELEIKRQKKLFETQFRSQCARLNDSKEIREYKKQLEAVEKNRLKSLEEQHESRVAKYQKIKKRGNEDEIKKQIGQWKKQGYNTTLLEKRYKAPKVSGLRGRIKQWKKQGYDTSVLDRKVRK